MAVQNDINTSCIEEGLHGHTHALGLLYTSTCPVSSFLRTYLIKCKGQQQLVSACLVVGGVAGVPGGVPVGHHPGCHAAVNPVTRISISSSAAAHTSSIQNTVL